MGQRLGNDIAKFLSDVFIVGRMHIEFIPWLLSESRWSELAVMLNGLGDDQWSTQLHAWLK